MSGQPSSNPRVEISHDLCAGVSMCMQAAPRAFRLNQDGQAVFQGPGTASRAELEDAAFSCPMAAIRVIDQA